MAAATLDLERDELEALEYLKARFPNRWKSMIRDAWMNGDYSPLCLKENQDQLLQLLRNTRGPTWLMNLKLPKAK